MNKKLSHIAALLVGGGLMLGGTELTQDAQVVDANADKQAILKYYVDAQVRLNETPTLDLSVASAEEMSEAYRQLATEKDAFIKENLFESLHDKAVEDGVACK